jgi:nitrogen-specific signal transduction histidine kinase/DNA-binding NarL/FixJ family response regulator
LPDTAAQTLLAALRERGDSAHAEVLGALLEENAALARAKEAAEAANEAKTRFLASVSHEIRSPLNAIYGYAQLLERGDGKNGVQAGKVIRRSAEHLSNLVEGLLDIAQVESGSLKLARDTIRFPAFLEQIVAMFEPQAAMKGLGLTLDLPPTPPEFVRTDPKRLRQVLINLLSNAIKFTDRGEVTLRVHYRNELATFEIIDSGIGIAPADIARIMLPFERGATSAERAGVGLGLAITQALVTIMGGEMRVESTPDEGSRFIVRLMLSQPLTPPADLPERAGAHFYLGRQRTLLLIDDDPAHREALRGLLEPRGFRVLTAQDGEEGLALAAQVQPDLVLLDVSMPGMNGWEIAAMLRKRHGAGLRIAMLSGEAPDQRPTTPDGPPNDIFIMKPFDFNILIDAISEQLGLEWPQTRTHEADGQIAVPPLLAAEARPLLAEIERLVRIGHVRAIETRIDELAAIGPDTAALAERMRLHLDAFDLKALATLATAGTAR